FCSPSTVDSSGSMDPVNARRRTALSAGNSNGNRVYGRARDLAPTRSPALAGPLYARGGGRSGSDGPDGARLDQAGRLRELRAHPPEAPEVGLLQLDRASSAHGAQDDREKPLRVEAWQRDERAGAAALPEPFGDYRRDLALRDVLDE